MNEIVVLERVTKKFGANTALEQVDLALPTGRVVGLVGRNGSGKTTLLRVACGLALPTSGACHVFGRPSGELRDGELARIGVVHQESRFLPWMRVRQHLDYIGSFHETWDARLERRLLEALDLDEQARIGTLSPGNVQKLALVTAIAPRPELLLLDEPVSALDPLARDAMLRELLALIREREACVVVASHVLRDVESVVDSIVCLDRGRVVVDAGLDELRERFAEWRVLARNGALPARFSEGFVLEQQGDGRQARLLVRDAAGSLASFEERHHVVVEVVPLNLERMFPLLLESER